MQKEFNEEIDVEVKSSKKEICDGKARQDRA